MNQRVMHYATILTSKLQELFDEETEYSISIEEFEDAENCTAFMHALATVTPNQCYNRLTGDDKNNLEFNHLANQLVFQFASKK